MKTLTIVSALALCCAAPALAHGGPRADPFGDAAVSKSDAEARAGARFAELDADHDGALTRDERRAGRGFGGARQRDPEGSARFVPQAPQTKDEFLAAQTQRFETLDADRDGTLTPDERRAEFRGRGFGGPGARGGSGGSDRLARGPQARDAYVAGQMQWFDTLDADRDGQLTKAERDTFRQRAGERFRDRSRPGA